MQAPSNNKRLLMVTPCRDEAEFARTTLDSVLGGSCVPDLWIVVDDGSTDETPAILAEYAARHDCLRIVRREDRGARSVGPGVIEAFYFGLEQVDLADFDYVCKLDLDLELPPDYFQLLLERLEADPRLGSASGKPYQRLASGELWPEPVGGEMSVGMTKLFKVPCFRQIGGFVRAVMWDGIDCHRARMLGWKTRAFDDNEQLRFVHLRAMGSSHKGILTGRQRHGAGQHFMGTGPGYLGVSALYRMAKPPLLIGGLGIAWGYLKAWVGRAPRYGDAEFRSFLRRFQRESLIYGKQRAMERSEDRQAAQWHARDELRVHDAAELAGSPGTQTSRSTQESHG